MASGELEPGLLVLGERERGWFEPFRVMALLAPVQPRRRSKLCLVLVVVAVQAARELDPVQRVLALGDVAAGAFHFRVSAFERVFRGGVGLHVKL